MELTKRGEQDLFEKFGLQLAVGDVEVGQTYPIFGMITKLLNEDPGAVVVEINHNIRARMNIPDQQRIELLKERAFESGIFISTIMSKEPTVEVECQTVIFGRRQGFNA